MICCYVYYSASCVFVLEIYFIAGLILQKEEHKPDMSS